nr:MAG TPA: hypothetical protein [Caudoviricetes sp.]
MMGFNWFAACLFVQKNWQYMTSAKNSPEL